MLQIPEVGPHYKILSFEKNENPENVLVVYTKLDENCRFIQKDAKPLIDFYWLMNGQRYKPTHALIKNAVRGRMKISEVDEQSFRLRINELKELQTDLRQPHLNVRVVKKGAECTVAAYFRDQNEQLIRVNSIFSESKKTFLPPFRKVLAVAIRGTASGEAVERKFLAR